MLFNSTEFLIFFVVVFVAYWAVPGQKVRVPLLLVASYYFYMSWSPKLAVVVAGSSIIDYLLARALESSAKQRQRKLLLVASIGMNLGLLFYFKYMNFFMESLGHALHGVGFSGQMPVLKVILPIGISFYTFEAISYMTDVYWKRTEAEKNPLHFLLFITFFPKMIAGPIIRARSFLPQMRTEKHFDWGRFDLGLQLILMGLFKKIVIADRMASLSDPVFLAPTNYSTGAVWIGVIAYSLQVYCDFSGYSDIAIGTAHMLGFKLPENFNMPYASRNITEFWRRWHISLSTWLRDYVYITMGGSRGTLMKTLATLILTFALCGLWHGAQWTFVVWGILQGLLLLAHRLFRGFSKNNTGLQSLLETNGGTVFRVLITYLSAILGFVIFRATDINDAMKVFHSLFIPQRGMMIRNPVGPWALFFSLAIVVTAHLLVETGAWKKIAARLTTRDWAFGYACVLALICALRTEGHKAFIYFQF